jgi:hypothetical protein
VGYGSRYLDLAADMGLAEWIEVGHLLGRINGALNWWVGDWLNHGELHYPELYAQGMEATGLAYETLQNIASICRLVDRTRRREDLSWSHHVEVAKFPPDEQTYWLNLASQQQLSKRELRERIRLGRDVPEPATAILDAEPPAPEPYVLHEPEHVTYLRERVQQVEETASRKRPRWTLQDVGAIRALVGA